MIFGLISVVCYSQAFHYAPVGKAGTIINLNPVILVILAGLVLRETITHLQIGCLITAFIGASLLALFKSPGGHYPHELLGCAIALGAAVAEALTYLSM